MSGGRDYLMIVSGQRKALFRPGAAVSARHIVRPRVVAPSAASWRDIQISHATHAERAGTCWLAARRKLHCCRSYCARIKSSGASLAPSLARKATFLAIAVAAFALPLCALPLTSGLKQGEAKLPARFQLHLKPEGAASASLSCVS